MVGQSSWSDSQNNTDYQYFPLLYLSVWRWDSIAEDIVFRVESLDDSSWIWSKKIFFLYSSFLVLESYVSWIKQPYSASVSVPHQLPAWQDIYKGAINATHTSVETNSI